MEPDFQRQIRGLGRLLVIFAMLLIIIIAGVFYLNMHPDVLQDERSYEDIPMVAEEIPLDAATIAQSGFVNDEGVTQVIQNCTQCHSAKLITQNRMSMEGWKATIVWMQETQNLWDLAENEEKIVNYLANNYAPEDKGRRQNLTNVEWYELK